jgi:hypothetical protein
MREGQEHPYNGSDSVAVVLQSRLGGALSQTRLGLRRAQGAEGRLDRGTTPFPVHMVLEFDS